MGAWGHGILQNDAAQDGICEVAGGIEADVTALPAKVTEATAARLGAGLGMLLQFSPYSFNPENPWAAALPERLDRHLPAAAGLPPGARRLLARLRAGEGPDLAAQPARLGKRLTQALLGDGQGFPVEKVFAKRRQALFDHPAAAAYASKVAGRCCRMVEEDLADEEVANDWSRESMGGLGAFGLLLILEPSVVAPARLERWRRRVARGMAWMDEEGADSEELSFYRPFRANLDLAFALLGRRGSVSAD